VGLLAAVPLVLQCCRSAGATHWVRRSVLQCAGSLGPQPWVAVYGDSVSRGMYFDLVTLLNGSADNWLHVVHPGHSANYSTACTLTDSRPPTRRPKCGAFDFVMPDSDAPGRIRSLPPATAPLGVVPLLSNDLRLSFRLKTFAWEPEYDEAWLRALRRSQRLPDVLLFSFGLWDMQYPPANDPVAGLSAFNASLRLFVDELRRSLAVAGRRLRDVTARRLDSLPAPLSPDQPSSDGRLLMAGGQPPDGSSVRRRPRLLWLSLTAISSARLPAWKRPRMSAEIAAKYNEVATPVLQQSGIAIIDTFSAAAVHPELSLDGIHYPGPVSYSHTEQLLHSICGDVIPRGSITGHL